MDASKIFSRPPFANYDLVVYFGGGLFAIPFLSRYVFEPLKLPWPKFSVPMDNAIATQIVAALALLFSIYIIGHIIAYLASLLIEGAINSILGKVSTAIILSSFDMPERNDVIKSIIFSRLKIFKSQFFRIQNITRIIFHAPVIPLYLMSFFWAYLDTIRLEYQVKS